MFYNMAWIRKNLYFITLLKYINLNISQLVIVYIFKMELYSESTRIIRFYVYIIV